MTAGPLDVLLGVSSEHFVDVQAFVGISPPEDASIFGFSAQQATKKRLSQDECLKRIDAVNVGKTIEQAFSLNRARPIDIARTVRPSDAQRYTNTLAARALADNQTLGNHITVLKRHPTTQLGGRSPPSLRSAEQTIQRQGGARPP